MSISREMLVSIFVGAIIISGSLYVNASNERVEGTVTIAPENKAPERTYIQPSDSDGDGISDWAEELLADRETLSAEFDPEKPYEAPTTLTGRFSLKFFQDYLISKGVGEFSDNKDELVLQATEVLKREAVDRVYSHVDIIMTDDNSPESIRRYGNAMAAIVTKDSTAVENEYEAMQHALNQNDPARLENIDPTIAAYEAYLAATLATPVPTSLAREHIDLVNVYNAILGDVTAMRNVFTDPLLGLLRVKRYHQDIEGMVFSFFQMDRALRQQGIIFTEGEPGNAFNQLGALRDIIK